MKAMIPLGFGVSTLKSSEEVFTRTYSSRTMISISLEIYCVGANVTPTERTYLGRKVTIEGPARRVRRVEHNKVED
jgi:hypothetical protein